jgi:hypothetical protein
LGTKSRYWQEGIPSAQAQPLSYLLFDITAYGSSKFGGKSEIALSSGDE